MRYEYLIIWHHFNDKGELVNSTSTSGTLEMHEINAKIDENAESARAARGARQMYKIAHQLVISPVGRD